MKELKPEKIPPTLSWPIDLFSSMMYNTFMKKFALIGLLLVVLGATIANLYSYWAFKKVYENTLQFVFDETRRTNCILDKANLLLMPPIIVGGEWVARKDYLGCDVILEAYEKAFELGVTNESVPEQAPNLEGQIIKD